MDGDGEPGTVDGLRHSRVLGIDDACVERYFDGIQLVR